MPIRLKRIFLHPVKSCGAAEVTAAFVTDRGLAHDRRFVVVDQEGQFLSQRRAPRMALVAQRLERAELVLTAPGMSSLCGPLLRDDGPWRTARVWASAQPGREWREGSLWFSEFLGQTCSLLYQPDEVRRSAGNRARAQDLVSYADAYPFLLLSEESLRELERRLGAEVDVRRFRPNLVVEGMAGPHAEDELGAFQLGEVTFHGVKPCDRCSVPGVDPITGEGGREPLRTLASYRQRDKKIWFGMNLVADGLGRIAVGDALVAPTR